MWMSVVIMEYGIYEIDYDDGGIEMICLCL